MQKQITIFGNEEEVKATSHPVIDLALVVRASEDLSAPCFVPGAKKGTWYMSIDGKAYAWAPGTMSGLTGDWKVVGAGSLTRALVGQAFTSMVGTCLMDGKAIKVLPSVPGSVTIASFGILSGEGRPKTYYRVGNRWVTK